MRRSIKKQLMMSLVPMLSGLCVTSAILSYWLVSTFSSEAFDRELLNSADSIVARVRVKQGRVMVDLPPAALAILRKDEPDKLYYRVLSADGATLTGDQVLPQPPSDLPIDEAKLSSTTIDGHIVRLAQIKTMLEDGSGQIAIVQIAETTHVRQQFQEKLVLSIAVPQLAGIMVGLFAAWYGISKILHPLRVLQSQVLNRSPADLGALPDDSTPDEVYPLVVAINRLFERLKEELQMHQRFIANAAHQLRTPLAGLKTYSSIGSEMDRVDDLKKIVCELDRGIDRASRMVTQLLALARTDGDPAIVGNKRLLDMNFVVSNVVEELVEQALRNEIELGFDPAQQSVIVQGEETNLRLMVTNLVENAIHYTPAGGRVQVSLSRSGNSVILQVCDTGPGIPANERERVFERFYRVVGASGNGSGLGLAIVREVVQAHDATICISGNADWSTMVVVTIPATTQKT